MKKTFATITILSLLFFSCNKDSVNTRPSLTLKSTSPDVVPINGSLDARLTFGDKEGDLDSIYIYKVRLNKQVVQTVRDTLKFLIPDYDKNTTGEINMSLNYNNHLVSALNPPNIPGTTPPQKQPDTLLLKFIVKDKAKNVSDTAYSSTIIVLRN